MTCAASPINNSPGRYQRRTQLAIINYLMDVNHKGHDEGGSNLGRVGPITEGLVGILVGVGACVAFSLWIGTRL